MRNIKTKFKKATATSRGKVIFSSILLVILLAITGGILYWQTHKKQIIREKLESAIEEKSGGFYNIKYDALDLDEITGFLSITNLTLTYDSSKYQSLADLHISPPTLFRIQIPELTVEGVKTPKALLDKEIDGRKLSILNPSIEIIYTMEGKDSTRKVPASEVYKQILGNLNQIKVDTVLITGAEITTRSQKSKQKGIVLKNASVQLIDVKIDSAANTDPSRLLFSKGVSFGFENLSWMSDDRLYKFTMQGVASNSTDKTVHVNSFLVDPQLGEDAFVKSLPTQDDRFDFSFKDITISNIDFDRLLEEELIAESILINAASFKIYRDLNISRDNVNRVGRYPHQILAKLPVPILVKNLTLNNGFMEYKERNMITKNSGKVQFYNINATIQNLTNQKSAINANNLMTADVNCSFMNKAPFKTNWQFYLLHPEGRFSIKGNLGSITGKDINSLAEPMGPARIEEGIIKGFNFDLDGNDYSLTANLRLLYDDLKIALLEKDKGAKEWDKKGLTSLFANFMIKDSNPRDDDEEPKSVTVTNERDTNRSIFNAAWKTLFKGIKATLGVKQK